MIEQADFNRASALAQRLRTPLIHHTLVEQGRIPQAFLLDQLARSWNVKFVDLTIGHVKGDVIGTYRKPSRVNIFSFHSTAMAANCTSPWQTLANEKS